MHDPKPPSMWKEGDRVSGGGWRTRWLIRVPHTLAPNNAPLCQSIVRYVAVSYQSARPGGYHPPLPWSPLFQGKRALLRCTLMPISRTRRLSPTASAVPLFQRKRAFLRCTLLPISRTRRLSPTVSAVPPLSGKEGFFACITHHFLSIRLPYYAPTVPPLIYWWWHGIL